MNKTLGRIVLAIILMAVLTIFVLWYSNMYREASEEFQDLYFAIGTALAGLLFYLLRDNPKFQNQKLIMGSSELLMLIMSPTFAAFKILREAFPSNPYAIIIPTIIALSSWYFVTIFRTSKVESKDEKGTFSLTMLVYWGFVLALIPFIWLAMQPRS